MAAQAAAQYVDDATSELLLMPDWGKNIEVADLTADPDFGREVSRALRKRLANKNPKVVQLALTLYDTTVKNGGHVYHLSACSREMVTAIAALAEGKGPCTDPDVAAAAAVLLQELAISFAPQASLFPWKFVMDQLSARGVRFPPIDPKAVLVFPVPADPLAGQAPSSSMASNATSGGGGGGGWGAQGQPGSMPPPPGIGYGGASSRGTSPLMQPLQQHPHPQPNTGRGGGQHQQRGSPATAPQPNNPDKLASQLAQVDRSFEKLRSDLQAVRAVVASTCRLAVSGQAALTNVAFLDSMDFLQQVPTRLAVLIEAGVAGALDEQLFEACLSVNDAVGRVLEACMPLLQPRAAAPAAAGDVDLLSVSTTAPSSSSSAFQQLSDLTSFDAPPPAAAAIGVGSGAGAAPSASSGRNDLNDLFGAASAPAAPAAVASPALRAAPVAAVTATTPFDSHPITSGIASSALAPAGPAAASHVDDFFNTPPPSSSSSLSMASSSQAVPSSSAPALEFAPVPVAPAHVDDGFASLPPSTSSLAAFDFDHPSAPSASSAAAVGVASLPPPRAPAAPSAGNGSTTSSVLAELDSLI